MRLLTALLALTLSVPALAQEAVPPATAATPAPVASPAAPVPATDVAPVSEPVPVAPEAAPAAPVAEAAPVDSAQVAQMQVERATSLATPAPMPVNSVFMLITNNTGVDDKLIAVKSPRTKETGLHTTGVDDQGVVSMRPVNEIAIPAGKMTVLAPMGDHIMLMGLTDQVKENSTFPVTLVFQNAGAKTVAVDVVNLDEFGKRFPRELMGDAVKKADDVREKLKTGGAEKSWTQKLRDRIRSLGGSAKEQAPPPVMNMPAPTVAAPTPSQAPGMRQIPSEPAKDQLPDPSAAPNAADIDTSDDSPVTQTPVMPAPAEAAPMDHSGH